MKITRTQPGRYYSRGASHTYTIQGDGHHGWLLTIAHATEVAGVKVTDPNRRPVHESHQPTKTLAAAVARTFEDLGDGYSPAAHGHRSRATEAIGRAYATDAAR